MSTHVRVPVASRRLWVGAASVTLLAAAAPPDARVGLLPVGWHEEAVVGAGPLQVAHGLLGAPGALGGARGASAECCGQMVETHWDDVRVLGRWGFHRKDTEYLGGIIRNLCPRRLKAAGDLTLRDLALYVAEAMYSGCRDAWRPVEPPVVVRVDFYRFARTLGGPQASARFDVAKNLKLPALAAALGILAHDASTVDRAAGVSLALAEPVLRLEAMDRGDYLKYYAEARRLVGQAYSAARKSGRDEPPTSLVIFLAGMAAASNLAPHVDPDLLVLARFAYARTRATLQWAGPLPVSPLARLAREVKRIDKGLDPAELARYLVRLYSAPTAAGRGQEDARRAGAAASAAVEYAHYMVEYAQSHYTGKPDYNLAYSAARLMRQLEETLAGAASQPLAELARAARRLARAASTAVLASPPAVPEGEAECDAW